MPDPPPSHSTFPGTSPEGRVSRAVRVVAWAAVALSWVVAAVLMWDAGTRVPDTERLSHSVMAPIPTARSLLLRIGRSALEALAVLVLLWPGWRRLWGMRAAAAGMGVLAWFVFTTPLALTRVEWVHRRWLAALAAALLVLALGRGAGRAMSRLRRKP